MDGLVESTLWTPRFFCTGAKDWTKDCQYYIQFLISKSIREFMLGPNISGRGIGAQIHVTTNPMFLWVTVCGIFLKQQNLERHKSRHFKYISWDVRQAGYSKVGKPLLQAPDATWQHC